jgi:hydroxypyruvate isomerase
MGIPIPQIGAFSPGMEQRARDTLHRICDLAESTGQVFTLENLNPIDHPGCPFGSTAAVLGLVSAVNRPQLRINLDLYHTQIGEGDLIRWCQACLPWIGEVQVADNPGRCEPGTGEINYAGVAHALAGIGYAGPIGMEAFAKGNEEAALEAFRTAFTV